MHYITLFDVSSIDIRQTAAKIRHPVQSGLRLVQIRHMAAVGQRQQVDRRVTPVRHFVDLDHTAILVVMSLDSQHRHTDIV